MWFSCRTRPLTLSLQGASVSDPLFYRSSVASSRATLAARVSFSFSFGMFFQSESISSLAPPTSIELPGA
jgi:hypothetical protein